MQNFGGTTKRNMVLFEKGLQWFEVLTKIKLLTQRQEFGRTQYFDIISISLQSCDLK